VSDKQPIDITPPRVTDMPNMDEPPINSSGGGFRIPSGKGGGMNSLLTMWGVPIIVAIAVFFIMGMMGIGSFVTKSDFTSNIGKVSTDMGTLKSDVANRQGEVQKVIDAMPTTIQKAVDASIKTVKDTADASAKVAATAQSTADTAQKKANDTDTKFTNYYNKADIDSKLTNQANYYSKVEVDARIATLTTDVATLKTQVSALQTPSSTTSGSNTDGLKITVKDLGTELLAGAFGFNSDQSIKLTIQNSGTKDISDLRFYVHLTPQDYTLSYSSIDTTNGTISLGGDLAFTLSSYSSDDYMFKSGRVSIGAGKTKNYYLTTSVVLKPLHAYLTTNVNYKVSNSTYNVSGATYYLSDTSSSVDSTAISNTYQFGTSKNTNDVTFSESIDLIDYNVN
jgi:hypothetical protein